MSEDTTVISNGAAAVSKDLRRYPRLAFWVSASVMWLQFFAIAVGFSFAIALVLPFPDTDFLLSPLLQHRSVLTHSIFFPTLLLVCVRRHWFLKAILSIAFAGIGIHLIADALSPAIGFGAVWLPPYAKLSLGEFSQVWLWCNGAASIVLANLCMRPRFRSEMVAGTLLAGAIYGAANEQSLLSLIFVLGSLIACYGLAAWRGWIPEGPISILKELSEIKRERQILNELDLASRRSEVVGIRMVLRRGWLFVVVIYDIFKWTVLNPRKIVWTTVLVCVAFAIMFFLGDAKISRTATLNELTSTSDPTPTFNIRSDIAERVTSGARKLIRGPRGGCYYRSNGESQYVDRSLCK